MAATLSLPRVFSLLQSYFDRRRRCHTCPDCGAEFAPNMRTLKQTGHHRARVFYARVALERRLFQLFARLPDDVQRGQTMSDRIRALHECGMLSRGLARRVARNWSRSSRICHGEPCDLASASQIVRAINVLLEEISDRRLSPAAVA